MSKWKWKNIIKEKTHIAALNYLTNENAKRDKTKNIVFPELKMSQYIYENKNTSLTRVIFSIRSKTLDVKDWNPWNYENLSCLQCVEIETMDHFVSCQKYGEALDVNWKEINESNTEKQIMIGEFVQKRHQIRQKLIKQQEDGQASSSGSTAPGTLSSVELQRNK